MNKSKMTFNKICKGVGQFFYKYRFLWMRIGVALFTLMLAMFLCFLILELMPADSIDQMAIKLAAERRIPFEEARELAIEILGYNPDESIWNKLGSYVSNLFEGNLGTSIVNPSINVNSVIKKTLPWTLFVATLSLIISFGLGTLLGAYMARYRTTFSLFWCCLCLPIAWSGFRRWAHTASSTHPDLT